MTRITTALSALLLLTSGASARTLSDLLGDGYAITRMTAVPGLFQGCDKDKRIELADGTIFVCGDHASRLTFEPKVVILRNADRNDAALLIGGQSFNGSILRLGHGTELVHGIRTWQDEPSPPVTTANRIERPLDPIEPVYPAGTPVPQIAASGDTTALFKAPKRAGGR